MRQTKFGKPVLVLRHQKDRKGTTVQLFRDIRRVRASILASAMTQPVLQLICGHSVDGQVDRSEEGHMAIVPLLGVDGETPFGLAIVPPIATPAKLLEYELQRLNCRGFVTHKHVDNDIDALLGAVSPRKRWVSDIPMALDRWPKSGKRTNVLSEIARTCSNAGLPPLCKIDYTRTDLRKFGGPAKPKDFIVKACLEFTEAVRGPVLLGRGRFLGTGVFVPCA